MATTVSGERIEPRTQTHYDSATVGYVVAGIVPAVAIAVNALKVGPLEAIPNSHFWKDGAGLSEYGVLAGLLILVANIAFHNYHGGWTYRTKSETKHWKETTDKSEPIRSDTRWVRNK